MFFLISVVCLGFIAAFLFRPSEIPTTSISLGNQEKKIDSTEVMVAEQDLKAGEKLNKNAYIWETVNSGDFNPSLVYRNPQTEKYLDDAIVQNHIPKGDKVKRFDIVWPSEIKPGVVGTKILPTKPGLRAVPFELSDRSGMAQFMQPGMFVDITFTSKSDIGFGTISLTLLKDIRVLAIGRTAEGTIGTENYKSNSPIEILLEMTPKQAEIFFYAQQTGKVSIGFVENSPTAQNDDALLEKLLRSESAGNFQSVLVTYMIRALFPGIDINITATPKGYIVKGKVPDPQVAGKIMEILIKLAPGGDKAIVDLMDVNPQQVLVCVKVCEVVSDFRCRLGINWQSLWSQSGQQIAFGATFPPPLPLDPNYFFSMTNVNIGNLSLSALVNMLEENKLGTILADPNLTTVSGQTAHFFAGGEFPILIPQGGQLLGTVTVEYKKYGIMLDLTPLVDINGLITLRIRPEVSTIDKENSVILQGFVIPSLKTRYADTMVKLWPGQGYIIAGLLEDESNEQIDSLYGLDKLPIIGPLFRSKTYEDVKTELMIFVTPYLINSDKTERNVPLTINQTEGPECCPAAPELPEDLEEEASLYSQWVPDPSCSEAGSSVPYPEFMPTPERPTYSQWEDGTNVKQQTASPRMQKFEQWEQLPNQPEEKPTAPAPEPKTGISEVIAEPQENLFMQESIVHPDPAEMEKLIEESYEIGKPVKADPIKISTDRESSWHNNLKSLLSNEEKDSLDDLRIEKKPLKQPTENIRK